jgi:glycosyltransferase involved in cell wall biosynthesis
MGRCWDGLAIVVPTFFRNDDLRRTIASIVTQTCQPSLVVVVDNSATGFARAVLDDPPVLGQRFGLRYVDAEANRGPAGSFALGIEVLHHDHPDVDWMLCRGDDNPFDDPGTIAQLHDFVERTRGRAPAAVGTIGGEFDPRRSRTNRLADEQYTGTVTPVDYIAGGGCPTYRVSALCDAGVNFDPTLFFGMEELDLGLRLNKAGLEILVDPVYVLELRRRAGRLGLPKVMRVPGRRTSPWRTYFSHRNRLIVARRHSGVRGFTGLLARSLALAAVSVVRFDGATAQAVSLGVVDGVLGRKRSRRRYIPTGS